jgi:hypothetical protein
MANSTTAVAALNKVQYVGLDFPTIFDDLRSELQTKFAAEFNDFALSSLAIMLLDISAYGLDSLAFYLDRRASDSYLDTAQTRKAVSRLTRQLGYKMGGAVSSSTDVVVSISNPVNFTVTIPVGFQFLGPNNLIFETAEAVTFAPRQNSPQTIPIYEGESLSESFVGDGTASQVFNLRNVPSGKNVVQGSVSVLVNGAPYAEADFLPVTGGQFFEVGYSDDPTTIRFGDGTVAQTDIPGPNSTIAVTYIAATGLAGQVTANTITKVAKPLVVSFQTIALSITNPEGAVGGDNPESLERAKYLAGQVYKSRQVAVTRSDYVALSSAFADPLFGRVAASQAYSTRSADSDLELQSLLQDVRNIVAPVATAVDAQVVALGADTAVITASNLTITTGIADIGVLSTGATGTLTTTISTLNSASNRAVLASSRCNDGLVTIGPIPVAATDQLTSATKTALQGLFTNINIDLVTMQSQIDSSVVSCGDVQDDLLAVGLAPTTPDSILLAQTNAVVASDAAVINIDTVVSPAITAAVFPFEPGGIGVGTINGTLDEIEAHVDAILSANCSANLVTVPILTRDASGFYVAPSLGLKLSLQTYLDARKAVTQTVQVVSGERSLIYAILDVQIGVRPGFSEQVARLAVESVLDNLLKNRLFGSSLYRSEITDGALTVAGVAFVNPTIVGYLTADSPVIPLTTKLDSFGNLIILDSEVVTKDSFVVTSVLYTGPSAV